MAARSLFTGGAAEQRVAIDARSTYRALMRSQSGSGAGVAFSTTPCTPLTRLVEAPSSPSFCVSLTPLATTAQLAHWKVPLLASVEKQEAE